MSEAEIFDRLNPEDRVLSQLDTRPADSRLRTVELPVPEKTWSERICRTKREFRFRFQIMRSNPEKPYDWEKAPPLSDPVRKRLLMAEVLIGKIKQKLPYSPNNYLRSKDREFEWWDKLPEKYREMTGARERRNRLFQGGWTFDELVEPEIDSFLPILKAGIGNCMELAECGLRLTHLHFPEERVEMVRFTQGDHCFLLIGRQENSDPEDFRSWGEAAVICDPWAGKCYPLCEVEKELCFYVSVCVHIRLTAFPIVIPFDAAVHRLEITEQQFLF